MAYLGKKTDGDTSGNPLNWSNGQQLTRWQAGTHGTGSFTAYYISHYITATSAGKFRGIIVSDNAGSPGSVIGCTYEVDVPAGSENTFVTGRLKKPVEIVNGSYYWVGFWYDDNRLGGRYLAASGQPIYGDGDPGGSYHATRCYGLSWTGPAGFYSFTQYASNNFASGILTYGGCVFEYGSQTYTMFIDTTGDMVIWKDLLAAPTLITTQTATNVHGGGAIAYAHACLDGNGVLHVVSQADDNVYTRDVAYNTFTLSSESWGTWESVATMTDDNPNTPGVAIDVDGGNIPHVLFTDGQTYHGSDNGVISYTNRSGGTWSTPEAVSNNTQQDWLWPSISLAPAGDVEAFFYNGDTGDPAYRRRNGSWGTLNSYTETAAYVPLNGVVVEPDDVVSRFHYTSGQDLQENNTSLSITVYSGADRAVVAPSISRAGPLVFYIDTNQDLMVYDTITNISTKVLTGTFVRCLAEYSYDYRRGYINVLVEEDTSNDLLFIRFNKSELITYI